MTAPDFALGPGALGALMPMHLCLDGAGIIRSVGPTLAKITPDAPLAGCGFFSVFEVRRPGGISDLAGLADHAGERLFLVLEPGGISLRGVAMPLATPGGGMIVNLSFGIALSDAVGRHELTDADFAPTDLAVEMLYLLEAKNSVMEELHNLNRRLHDARLRAEEQALTDTLTGLQNRRAMDGMLGRLIAADDPFGLMHIDLDLFKQVNDTLGHAAGDHVLVQVARVLQSVSRTGDGVFRVGGDEFVIVFPGLADAARLRSIARRMIEALGRPIPWAGGTASVSASVGIVVSTLYTEPQADRMLSDADHALSASKNAGRGRVTLHGG